MDWGKKWLVDFNAGKTQLVSFDRSNNNGYIDVKMDGPVLEEKPSFKMLGLTFSSKLDWGSYIISIAKTASKKIGVLIRSMKFLFPEIALYLYEMVRHKLVRRNYGGKRPVSIKYQNLHSFKEGMILLCQSILEKR